MNLALPIVRVKEPDRSGTANPPMYPFQMEAIEAVRAGWDEGRRSLLVNLPTGCGKTRTGLYLAAQVIRDGGRVLWVAHREELITQPRDQLAELWPDTRRKRSKGLGGLGIVKAKHDDLWALGVFASIDTLRSEKRLKAFLKSGVPDLVVYDECHHSVSPGNRAILETIDNYFIEAFDGDAGDTSGPVRLGLTATLERGDGVGLSGLWEIAYAYPLSSAIDGGYLTKPVFEVDQVSLDLSTVKMRGKDYDVKELGDALLAAEIVRHTVNQIQAHAAEMKGIIFTATVEQAQLTADALNQAGFTAEYVSGMTSQKERQGILNRSKLGVTRWVCNCAVLTEGYDDPTAQCVIIARPTKSKTLFIQMVGRGLRKHKGKDSCLILDLAGASLEHSLVQAPVLVEERTEVTVNICDTCDNSKICVKCDGTGRVKFDSCKACDGDGICSVCRPGEGEGRSLYAGMVDKREREQFHWTPVPRIDRKAYSVAFRKWTMVLVELRPDAWFLLGIPSRKIKADDIRWQNKQPMNARESKLIADDIARRSQGKGSGEWRKDQPTEKQLATLKSFKCKVVPENKGRASDLLSAYITGHTLVRCGIVSKDRSWGGQ